MAWVELLPSGKYRGLYRDNAGRRRSAGTFGHKRAAERAAIVAEADARKLGWRDPAAGLITWGEWVTAWWPTRSVEPGTLARDLSRLHSRLSPRWHDVALAHITRHDVKTWVAELTRSGLAPATVQRCLHLLSASLTAAIDAEILTANPAYRIQIAKGEADDMRFLTRPEFAAIAAAMPSEFDEALASELVGTGMRWGEAVGLQIPRIDFDRGQVRVVESWDDRMGRLKPYPKGRRIRDVPLPAWVGAQVQPIIGMRRTGGVWTRGDAYPGYSNWRARVWLPALRSADVGHVRIHDLRHTYASWLIQDGVSLAEVGRLLGHVSWQTTLRYAHLAEIPRAHILAALPNPSRGADVGQPIAAGDYTTLQRITPRTAGLQGD